MKLIQIIGKRWFDKVNGNTYHSTRVYVNNKELAYSGMTYGYDDQYLQTGKELLIKHKVFRVKDSYELTQMMRRHRKHFLISVSDGLKREL